MIFLSVLPLLSFSSFSLFFPRVSVFFPLWLAFASTSSPLALFCFFPVHFLLLLLCLCVALPFPSCFLYLLCLLTTPFVFVLPFSFLFCFFPVHFCPLCFAPLALRPCRHSVVMFHSLLISWRWKVRTRRTKSQKTKLFASPPIPQRKSTKRSSAHSFSLLWSVRMTKQLYKRRTTKKENVITTTKHHIHSKVSETRGERGKRRHPSSMSTRSQLWTILHVLTRVSQSSRSLWSHDAEAEETEQPQCCFFFNQPERRKRTEEIWGGQSWS